MSFINQNILDDSYKGMYTNIKNHILYSLGYPLVRVELVEEHLILAIVEAIQLWYSVAAEDKDFVVVPVLDGNVVDIPTDIYKDTIEDIIFPISSLDSLARGFGGVLPEGDGAIMAMTQQRDFLNHFDLSSYLLYTQRIEDFRSVLGIKKHWDIINNQIVLYPQNATYTQVGILYKDLNTEREFEQEPWIKAYALARAKHILGTIRSKMSGFQAANSNIAQDGEALKTEAKEEMEKLREDLDKLQAPLPIMQI